jgi:hypothetical protein
MKAYGEWLDMYRNKKNKRMRWAGHVVRMGEKRNAYKILVGKPEGKNHWEDQDVGGWTMSKFSEILGFRTLSIVLVIKKTK